MTEPYSKQAVSDTSQRVTEEARSSFESNSMRVGYAMGDLERDANGKYVYLGMEASFDSYLMGWIARGKQEGWISVLDRLPYDCVDYLVYSPGELVRISTFGADTVWLDIGITHWHELPAAPTETGQ